MRLLAQPRIVRSAILAATGTALACYPRLVLRQAKPSPAWYLDLVLLFGSFFLWSFVLGWEQPYGGRDPLRPSSSPRLWSAATAIACALAALNYWEFDPELRSLAPEEFPASPGAWLAMVLFSIGLTQLFVLFAPLAFFRRMVAPGWPAFVLALVFNAFVMLLKSTSTKPALPAQLIFSLLLLRISTACLLLHFYQKGGLLMAWWMTAVIDARQLFELSG